MSHDRRRDGSKLTYAERDKQRRERGQQGRPEPAAGPARSHQADKSYRAALEKAFATGRVQEMADSLAKHNTISLALPTTTLRPATGAELAPPPAAAAAATRRPAMDPAVAERRDLTEKIRSAENARDTAKAIDKYLTRFTALPRDWDILEKALAHARADVVIAALGELEAWLAREKPRRNRSLGMQLTILADTHDDGEVQAHAARVRAAL